MKKNLEPTELLQELIKKREENILLLSKWTNNDLKMMVGRYREALDIAYQNNKFDSFKILVEKISQINAALSLKFCYSKEASDWIHW